MRHKERNINMHMIVWNDDFAKVVILIRWQVMTTVAVKKMKIMPHLQEDGVVQVRVKHRKPESIVVVSSNTDETYLSLYAAILQDSWYTCQDLPPSSQKTQFTRVNPINEDALTTKGKESKGCKENRCQQHKSISSKVVRHVRSELTTSVRMMSPFPYHYTLVQ